MIIIARSRGVYNRVYTDEKYALVNPINKAILDDFISEYKQRKKAKGTIDGYESDIKTVFIHILDRYENKSILELTKKDFRNISLLLSEEMDLSSARTNRIKSALNSMLTFVEEDEEDYKDYNTNLARKVRGLPKVPVKINEDNFFFTFDEFLLVRDKLVEKGDLQTAIMWSIAFDSGGRKNEVYQIQKHGLLNGNKTNIVKGKRGKNFPLFYLDDTKELIRQYLEQRQDDSIDSLWVQYIKGEKFPVKYESMYSRFMKCNDILSEIRGTETSIFFHSCRHSRIEVLSQGLDMRLLDENGNPRKFTLEEIAVLVNHESISTTQGYVKNHDEDTILSMFNLDKKVGDT